MKTQPRSSRAQSSSSGYGSASSRTFRSPPERAATHSSRRRQAAVRVGDHEYMRAEATGIMHPSSHEELALVRVRADRARPVRRHEYLLLQLHAERRADLSRVALEAQHHVLLELALGHDPTRTAIVVGVGDAGAFVLEPGLVHHRRI